MFLNKYISGIEQFEGERSGTFVQFELQKDDKANGAQLNNGSEKWASKIKAKQVCPKVRGKLRVQGIDEYIH